MAAHLKHSILQGKRVTNALQWIGKGENHLDNTTAPQMRRQTYCIGKLAPGDLLEELVEAINSHTLIATLRGDRFWIWRLTRHWIVNIGLRKLIDRLIQG